MAIRIINSPDANFTPYVQRAAKFFADRLLSKQMQDNTLIVIKFNKNLKDDNYILIFDLGGGYYYYQFILNFV